MEPTVTFREVKSTVISFLNAFSALVFIGFAIGLGFIAAFHSITLALKLAI